MRPIPLLSGLALCACLIGAPAPALSQYLYLDANGDGIHSAADVLSSQGPTTLDVWLRTNANRDGSVASCGSGGGDLTVNSYEFILHVAGGTVSWGAPVNHMTTFTVSFGLASDASDFYMGWGGPEILPPGAYRLATLEATVLTGSPSLAFVPSTPLSGAYGTSFGSQCEGLDQDNTLKLGRDWTDADGTFGAPTNRAPSLVTRFLDMLVQEQRAATLGVVGQDPDGDPVAFAKLHGPAFMSVATTSATTGTIYLAPAYGDRGTYVASVGVSDPYGLGDSVSLQITVLGSTAPTLSQPANMTVVESHSVSQQLTATDPDGGFLTFSMISGPFFMTVSSTSSTEGRIYLNPPQGWRGSYVGVVGVSDGFGSDQKSLEIVVLPSDGQDPPDDPPDEPANQAPVFGAGGSGYPTSMLVFTDRTTEQTIAATDPDDSMTFLKGVGPDFMTVTTTSSGPGVATGTIRLSPGPDDYGVSQATVIVTDGQLQATAWFTIDVRPVGVGAPLILPVSFSCAYPGQTSTIPIRALDPDNDPLTFSQEGLPAYAGFTDLGSGSAVIQVTAPPGTQPEVIFVTVSASDGNYGDSEIVAIGVGTCSGSGGDTVGGVGGGYGGSSLTALASGPYTGVVGAAVAFDGNLWSPTPSSGFAFRWDFGDGTTAIGATPSHVYHRAGIFRATLLVTDGVTVSRDETTVTIAEAYAARAFAPAGHTTIRLHTGKPSYCFSSEPVGGGYDNHQVDPASIVLTLPGTGSAPSLQGKSTVVRDRDENGIAEIDACFAKEDLAALFGSTEGSLSVLIEGNVDTGGRFRAPLALIVQSRGPASATLTPQPMRSDATLRFTTTVAGPVRVRVFDVHGRLVRTLMDEAHARPGTQELMLGGTGQGTKLPSGVYWYRIEASGEPESGRFVVVR